ncbi:helitron_like_N domain-containing protein [Nephila pilipes]|uniref:Helitron_like_N domain-containing protein n=1 Tax=Nephila pilipes TaxID=299642 RepID=A0A8X6TD65_NEPPI|nr:helitron_like_N domain-containing protein [Nephila pilipes]
MDQIHAEEAAEQHAARFEDARLQVRQSCSATSNVLRLNKENTIGYKWLKDVNKEKHISLRCLAFRYNPVRLLKTAIDMMPSDTHKIVIQADRMPAGEHVRRFNAPTVDQVAIIIVGAQFQSRDIVLHRRNEQLTKIAVTHRCYDALQYLILLSFLSFVV